MLAYRLAGATPVVRFSSVVGSRTAVTAHFSGRIYRRDRFVQAASAIARIANSAVAGSGTAVSL